MARAMLHNRIWAEALDAPGRFGVLYLNATIAAGNARRAFEGEIATLFDLKPEFRPDVQLVSVKPVRVVDAATAKGLRALRLPRSYPRGASWKRCQAIGAHAYDAGENGVACRSGDATARTALVVEGEELVVFDRALACVTRGARVPFSQWYPLEVEQLGRRGLQADVP